MKDEKYPFGLAFTLILFCVFFGTLSFMGYKQEASKRIVFKECLRRAAEFDDNHICDCAEFVGRRGWCDDLNY